MWSAAYQTELWGGPDPRFKPSPPSPPPQNIINFKQFIPWNVNLIFLARLLRLLEAENNWLVPLFQTQPGYGQPNIREHNGPKLHDISQVSNILHCDLEYESVLACQPGNFTVATQLHKERKILNKKLCQGPFRSCSKACSQDLTRLRNQSWQNCAASPDKTASPCSPTRTTSPCRSVPPVLTELGY